MATPSFRAPWARSSHIFIRHVGAKTKDVYFRVNPQALRVQQGNKGSVVDTLGGYFREVMYSEDPQHNGLLLPDLTIECETGAGYRKELKRLEWVWKNHGTPKADGSPADTYLMDMADEDTLFSEGAVTEPAGKGTGLSKQLPQGVDPAAPPLPGVTQTQIQRILNIKRKSKMPLSRTLGGSRFVPRAFKIEILNFSWDESVQDPYRIRFNFRCKILRDMFWTLDKNIPERGATTPIDLGSLSNPAAAATVAKVPISKAGMVQEALKKSSDYPLNIGAHVAMLTRTLELIPGAGTISGQVEPILNQLLQVTGLGQNQPLTTAQNNGQSVYNPAQGQRLYWRSEFATYGQTQKTTQEVSGVLDGLPGAIQPPQVQSGLQVPGWNPATVDILSPVVSALSLQEFRL